MKLIASLKASIAEGRRYIKAAEAAVKQLEETQDASVTPSRKLSAARRASLDLSAALVDMRKVRKCD